MALQCVSRLIWTYLYRCPEPIATTHKKLDSLIRTLFPPNRKNLNPSDTPLSYFIQITHMVSTRHTEYTIKQIIFFLLNLDGPALTFENFSPERVIIAVETFLSIPDRKGDKERTVAFTRPPFPMESEFYPSGAPIQLNQSVASPSELPIVQTMEEDVLKDPLERIGQYLGLLLK